MSFLFAPREGHNGGIPSYRLTPMTFCYTLALFIRVVREHSGLRAMKVNRRIRNDGGNHRTPKPSQSGQSLSPVVVSRFRAIIYGHYAMHRRTFPWRETRDPYKILVSEVMLQQTQTSRVVPKYENFIDAFPDFSSLAASSVREALELWQGLGYNRRALALRETATRVVSDFQGELPASPEILATLPGIGGATASAIGAFAFDLPACFIETNIRRAFIHFFFRNRENIRDRQILPLVGQTLDRSNPRDWYFALMDYGEMLKRKFPNPNRKSAHYSRQSSFEGSNRQLRGRILTTLLNSSGMTERMLCEALAQPPQRIRASLSQLKKEGFIRLRGSRIHVLDQAATL